MSLNVLIAKVRVQRQNDDQWLRLSWAAIVECDQYIRGDDASSNSWRRYQSELVQAYGERTNGR